MGLSWGFGCLGSGIKGSGFSGLGFGLGLGLAEGWGRFRVELSRFRQVLWLVRFEIDTGFSFLQCSTTCERRWGAILVLECVISIHHNSQIPEP